MGKISILDCTIRDGGYINDWRFGKDAIQFILQKLGRSNIDYVEVGFIKDTNYDPDRAVFPNVSTMNSILPQESTNVKYVGMVDMSKPIPLSSIPAREKEGIAAIRVIFKQDKIEEGFTYVKEVIARGYLAMVQLVSTDTYTDSELVDVICKFNQLKPYAVYIVDSLGLLSKRDFLRMAYIMDNNLLPDISLGYHSHNNLQQARQNAESLVELGLSRDLIIDASVFGMGRGAGNLNEELFADYLNIFHGKNYRIEPMLEIIDEYLNDIYKNNFWGYSLPFYLSAKNKVHPNYAKFYSEKGTLTEKAFDELLKTITSEDSHIFSEELANKYYLSYMERYIDDRNSLSLFSSELSRKSILILGPGESLKNNIDEIKSFISNKEPVVISIGFIPSEIPIDYVFCSNNRKYDKLSDCETHLLATSNIHDAINKARYIFNYDSYLARDISIVDNSGLMLMKILRSCGINKIFIAGMDGYKYSSHDNKVTNQYSSVKNSKEQINLAMSVEIDALQKDISIIFITPSEYLQVNKEK